MKRDKPQNLEYRATPQNSKYVVSGHMAYLGISRGPCIRDFRK